MKRISIRATVVALGLASFGVSIAETSLEAYGSLPTVATMAISPNGDRVAFRRTDDAIDAVFVMDITSNEVIGAVDGSETKIRQVSFLDQNQLLLFAEESLAVRVVAAHMQISASYLFDVRTRELSKLLKDSRKLYPLQSGAGRIIGHNPDKGSVYMPAYIGERIGPPATFGLLEVSRDSPSGRILARGSEATRDWFVDKKGNILAEEEYDHRSRTGKIWGRDGRKRVLTYKYGEGDDAYSVVGVSQDSKSLIVSSRIAGTEFRNYFEMSIQDGSVGSAIFQREDTSVQRPMVDANRRVFGVEYSGFMPSYEFFDSDLTARIESIQSSMKSTAVTLVDWTPDFRYLLFRLEGGRTSGAYAVASPDSPNLRLLSNIREKVPAEAVAPVSIVRYEARDALTIPALVTARFDVREAGNAPLIVLPHGGPAAYDEYGFDWIAQYFASRGIMVLQPQFRGSTGFGISLQRAGQGQWGGAMSTDLDDGVLFLVDKGLVDPERVCMVGSSYGGYAVLAAGAFSTFNYKCLVAISGVSDLPEMLKSKERKYGRGSLNVEYWQRQFGSVGKRHASLKDLSPVNFAENFRAPVLLVHGRDDTVVPIQQSERMLKSLKRAKIPAELIKLKGEDHYLSSNETRLEALRVVAEFVEKNL